METILYVLTATTIYLMLTAPMILKIYANRLIQSSEGYNPLNKLLRLISFGAGVVLILSQFDYPQIILALIPIYILLVLAHAGHIGIKHAILFSFLQLFSTMAITILKTLKWVAKFAFHINFENSGADSSSITNHKYYESLADKRRRLLEEQHNDEAQELLTSV